MTSILIDGITGFLGKEFVRALVDAPENEVFGIVRGKRKIPFSMDLSTGVRPV